MPSCNFPSQEHPQLSHHHPQIIVLVCPRQSCLAQRKKEISPCNRATFLSFPGTKPQRSPCFPGERCRGAGMVLQSCHRPGKGQEIHGQAIPTARMPWGYQDRFYMCFPIRMKQKRRKNACQVRETATMTGWRAGSRRLFWRSSEERGGCSFSPLSMFTFTSIRAQGGIPGARSWTG